MPSSLNLRHALSGAVWLAAPTLSFGQSVPDVAPTQLPEVTVTVERTETLLRKTPVSVGVVDAATIEIRGVRQLNDLVGVVAGVAVPNGSSNMPQAVGIRGVGVSMPAMSQAVGIYLDDVPLIRGYATALWDLPDIERIEVLRGPQGSLYGQNSSAGAVKLVSIDPSAQASAWASASVGDYGARELHGYANGAIAGTPLSSSIAVSALRNDGFGRNATLGTRVNKLDATQFRAKLAIAPGAMAPGVSAVLAVDALRDTSDNNAANYPLNHADAAPRVLFSVVDNAAFKRQAAGVSLKLVDALSEALVLRSITAFRVYRDDPSSGGFGGLEVERFGLSQVVEQKAFSQEIQLQGTRRDLSWTTGLMLVNDRFDFDRFSAPFPTAAAAASHSEAQTHLETTDLGVYGQAHVALTARTGLTAGARAWTTRQTGSNQYWVTDDQQRRTTRIYLAPDLSVRKSGLLPRLGLDHQLNPDLFLYGSVAQGAKFGGFNRAAASLIAAQYASDPEKVTTWELGAKSRLLDGRMTANLALFVNDYRDYLATLTNTTIGGVLVTDGVLINAGDAKTYGLDLDLSGRLAAQTQATLSLELLRSRFDSFANPTGAASGNVVGHELPYAPRVSVGASLDHRLPLPQGDALAFNASAQYVRAQYSDVANTELLKMPSQAYLNLAASYLSVERHWTFSLRVKNLTNRSYVLLRNRVPSVGVDAAYYNPPRTVLLTARCDF
jgi:iron complex outermembrane receptor protein